jgi:hypothetical protein
LPGNGLNKEEEAMATKDYYQVVLACNNVASKFPCGLCGEAPDRADVPITLMVLVGNELLDICYVCAKKHDPTIVGIKDQYYQAEDKGLLGRRWRPTDSEIDDLIKKAFTGPVIVAQDASQENEWPPKDVPF